MSLLPNSLILASAGSGKTFQLGNRVISLVARGVDPEKIVALTFTRKAAGEFTDTALQKLAAAAADPTRAARLSEDIGLSDVDFSEVLERTVRALPQLNFGTLDSYFARIVRGFQYELGLTGGKFDLLQGPRATAATDEILANLLGECLDEGSHSDEFLHAFRRACMGREEQGVMKNLRNFVGRWQEVMRSHPRLVWAPAALADAAIEDWEKSKYDLAATILRDLEHGDYTDKRQRPTLEKIVEALRVHTIGSGRLSDQGSKVWPQILEAAQSSSGALELHLYKPFQVRGLAAECLCSMVRLAANCEMAAALTRTRAIREVVIAYDDRCERQLRRKGLLGFNDVKILMGDWANHENARLRREAVDFRLGGRHQHWLLDEFQDTSRADWLGLQNLVEEAQGDGDESVFIVGDKKQAIYGWRGGDVRLFDVVQERFGDGIEVEPMTESYRSCPEVLALVNEVFSNGELMGELFGKASQNWHWQNHISAKHLAHSSVRGEARVEIVEGEDEDRMERLCQLLKELGVGKRKMTCGVLVRSNKLVRSISEHLSAAGFDVIQEGSRHPAEDNPVGIAISKLLRWLANPDDSFAHEVLEMSFLAPILKARFGVLRPQIWKGLLDIASRKGYAAMVEELIQEPSRDWSDFGRSRAGDLLMALAAWDASGGHSPEEAASWIEHLEVSQSPGISEIQVMTIHQSKGLGFDAVVLPEIPDTSIPLTKHFNVAQAEQWISQTPPSWARGLIPEICEVEETWAASQAYEEFCTLYVAMTRAKRGLYIFLKPPPKEPSKTPSLKKWLRASLSSESDILFQRGSIDWVENLPLLTGEKSVLTPISLIGGIPRRSIQTPTLAKTNQSWKVSKSGMKFGNEVHALFEKIGWLDEQKPTLPKSPSGNLVAEMLLLPEFRVLFERRRRNVTLLREQPIDSSQDGNWTSGVIDRIHLFRDETASVTHIELIDFKTDQLTTSQAFIEKYAGQMESYKNSLTRAYPLAEIECIFISTHCRNVIAL